jgi:UDP-N-acetylglucosamine 2-epimerase
MRSSLSVMCVVGARPNFVKSAPVLHALGIGGHVDIRYLRVGSGSHPKQTTAVLLERAAAAILRLLGRSDGTGERREAA